MSTDTDIALQVSEKNHGPDSVKVYRITVYSIYVYNCILPVELQFNTFCALLNRALIYLLAAYIHVLFILDISLAIMTHLSVALLGRLIGVEHHCQRYCVLLWRSFCRKLVFPREPPTFGRKNNTSQLKLESSAPASKHFVHIG